MANVSKPARTSPPVRISYPTLFTAKSFAGGTPKFGVVIMFDKTNADQMAFLKLIHGDCTAALAEHWPDVMGADGSMIPNPERPRIPVMGHTDSPIKDGDKTSNRQGIPMAEKNPEYAGHYIIRASSTSRPIVVSKAMAEVLDQAEVYGGSFCKVNLNCYTFEVPTNKGVTFGLNGVQKMSDGESFGGGRPAVDSMFAAESGANDAANYNEDPFANGAGDPGAFAGDDDLPF